MAGLVLAMLRARRGQALTVWLLSVLATAAAVVAPVYLAGIDRAIVAGELASASVEERTLRVSATIQANQSGDLPHDFERLASDRLDAPGFVKVFSAEFAAMPGDVPSARVDDLRRIMYRDDLCEHVVVVAGRCLMGGGETVLGPAAAQRFGLVPGSRVISQAATFDPFANRYVPAGAPWTMTVVGLVRPRDPAELYWGRAADLPEEEVDSQGEPLYVSRYTLADADHSSELQSFDGYATAGAVTVEGLPALRGWLDGRAGSTTGVSRVSTALPDLLDRIDASREQARRTVPVQALPLAVLAWAVIVFAVTTGARARRFEFGMVALRGVAVPARWWLAAGETVVPLLAGAPVGFLAGWLVAGSLAPATPALNASMVGYAAVAVLGAVVAGLAVLLRTIGAPVTELLRDVDRRSARWRSLLVDALVALLAAVALVQVRGAGWAGLGAFGLTPGDTLVGVALLAPALVIAAVGLVGSRLLPVAANRLARRWLRRGRLVGALTAVRLARRPAGHRLLVLLVVAVGTLGLASTATAVAARSQTSRAGLLTGASTVLSVDEVTRAQLLRGVRAADPDGRFAMAVVPLESSVKGMPPSIAVDSSRLAAVALWPSTYSRQPPAELARLLRPTIEAPFVYTGTRLSLDVTVADLGGTSPELVAVVAPADGRPNAQVRFGRLAAGQRTYEAPSSDCAAGCRLVSIELDLPTHTGPVVELTLHRIQGRPLTGGWKGPVDGKVTIGADGLVAELPASARRDAGRIRPPDVPNALPLVTSQPLAPDGSFASFDGRPVTATVIGSATTLPRVGGAGALVDLEAADLVATDPGLTDEAEVWLSAAAPPSIVDRLREQGITVTGRRTVAAERAALERHGGALALRFSLLAGVCALVLGAAGLVVTTVTTPTGDLEALRRHGLSARVTRRVEFWTPVSVVLVALFIGTVSAAVAWWGVGDRLPVLAGSPDPTPGPGELVRPLWTLLAAGVALVVVAASAAVFRRRARFR